MLKPSDMLGQDWAMIQLWPGCPPFSIYQELYYPIPFLLKKFEGDLVAASKRSCSHVTTPLLISLGRAHCWGSNHIFISYTGQGLPSISYRWKQETDILWFCWVMFGVNNSELDKIVIWHNDCLNLWPL